MRNRFYILALVVGLAPGIALAQDQQTTDRDRDMQRQQEDMPGNWNARHSQEQRDNGYQKSDQDQRSDQDYRGSRLGSRNWNNRLHQRFPNSNMSAEYRDNNTVVLTGNAGSDRDRQEAEQWVRSQAGDARVIDRVTVNGRSYDNGYSRSDRDRSNRNEDYDNSQHRDRDRNRPDNDQGQDQDKYPPQ